MRCVRTPFRRLSIWPSRQAMTKPPSGYAVLPPARLATRRKGPTCDAFNRCLPPNNFVTCTRTSRVPGAHRSFRLAARGGSFGARTAYPGDPAFHDARTASADRHRCVAPRTRLGRSRGVGVFCPRRRCDRTSDTSVASPASTRRTIMRTFVRGVGCPRERQGRFHRAPVMGLGLVGRRYLPSMRTLRVVQSPLRRWARDRRTFLREMYRPLHGACHTMRGFGRSRSVSPPRPGSRRFFARRLPSKFEDSSELGHRAPAPATFFEVRFEGLFEARRRSSTSATKHDVRARPSSEGSSQDEGRNPLPALATASPAYEYAEKRPRGASHARPVVSVPAPISPACAGLRRRTVHPACHRIPAEADTR